MGSIEQVSKLLKCKPHQMIKTLIYLADEHPVAVLVRGDHEANEGKIRRALGVKQLALAEPDVILQVTKAPVGFAGPVGLSRRRTMSLPAKRSVTATFKNSTAEFKLPSFPF